MLRPKTWFAVAMISLSILSTAIAQDPFAAGVRPTDPLSPQDEQKALLVPNGFEVQLVAAEPDIFKPMNMAFDERGRMWITDSLEYPWAAPLDKPARDSVKILHNTDGDGKADVIKTFADGLNIPIGIYPFPSRKDEATGKTIQGAIVYSIPNIWHLRRHRRRRRLRQADEAVRPVRLHPRHARHVQRLPPRLRRLDLRLPRLQQRSAR